MNEYPLTPMETRLKERYLSRPDIHDTVLNSRELSEYIFWLARTEAANDKAYYSENQKFTDITPQITRNPRDEKAIGSLAAMFANQREDRYLLAELDISVGRMFRYMPAHWHTNEYFEVYYCFSGQ